MAGWMDYFIYSGIKINIETSTIHDDITLLKNKLKLSV